MRRVAFLALSLSVLAFASNVQAEPRKVAEGEKVTGWLGALNEPVYGYATGRAFELFRRYAGGQVALTLPNLEPRLDLTLPDRQAAILMLDTGEVRELTKDTQILLVESGRLLSKIVVLSGPYLREVLWIAGHEAGHEAGTIRYLPSQWPGLRSRRQQLAREMVTRLDELIRTYDARIRPKQDRLNGWREWFLYRHPDQGGMMLGMPNRDVTNLWMKVEEIQVLADSLFSLERNCGEGLTDTELDFVPRIGPSIESVREEAESFKQYILARIDSELETDAKFGPLPLPRDWIEAGDECPCCDETPRVSTVP